MNRVLTGRELTASLPSSVYKSATSRVYMRSLPLPLNRFGDLSESEIALLESFGSEAAQSRFYPHPPALIFLFVDTQKP
jgi:hypothetical protein